MPIYGLPLDVEPVIFQKKLAALFRRHPNTEEVEDFYAQNINIKLYFSSSQAVREFADGLTRYTEDAVR